MADVNQRYFHHWNRKRNCLPERGIEELRLVWGRRSIDAFDVKCPHQHGQRINRYFLREILPWAGPVSQIIVSAGLGFRG